MTDITRDKLASIIMGDTVSYIWMDGTRRSLRSGVVNGWHFDKFGRHNLEVYDGGQDKETPVLLATVVSRRRRVGSDKGVISWHQDGEHGTMSA